MIDWKRKLTSRKFWAAVCNFITQLLIVFHFSESETTQIVGLVMAGAGVIAYIIGEGLADAANTPIYYVDPGEADPGEIEE